jgi:hypothetical protein
LTGHRTADTASRSPAQVRTENRPGNRGEIPGSALLFRSCRPASIFRRSCRP